MSKVDRKAIYNELMAEICAEMNIPLASLDAIARSSTDLEFHARFIVAVRAHGRYTLCSDNPVNVNEKLYDRADVAARLISPYYYHFLNQMKAGFAHEVCDRAEAIEGQLE